MTRQDAVHVLAGSLVLLGVALSLWVNPWWLALSAFVGLNLLQSAFTHFCPAEMIFARLGLRNGAPTPHQAAANGYGFTEHAEGSCIRGATRECVRFRVVRPRAGSRTWCCAWPRCCTTSASRTPAGTSPAAG